MIYGGHYKWWTTHLKNFLVNTNIKKNTKKIWVEILTSLFPISHLIGSYLNCPPCAGGWCPCASWPCPPFKRLDEEMWRQAATSRCFLKTRLLAVRMQRRDIGAAILPYETRKQFRNNPGNTSSCMPRICAVFYSIGRAYRFGFSKAGFLLENVRENWE